MVCPICGTEVDECFKDSYSTLYNKGAASLQALGIECSIGQKIHKQCRIDFLKNPRHETSTSVWDSSSAGRLRRSQAENMFDFKNNCFFCGNAVSLTSKADLAFQVRSLLFQSKMLEIAIQRNDEWGNAIHERLNMVIDLPAADACYHQSCNVNFRTAKQIPKKHSSSLKRKSAGRPVNEERSEAFIKVIDWFENNDEDTITIKDLITAMNDFLPANEEPFSVTYMRKKLKDHYKNEIVFHDHVGSHTTVTLQLRVETIVDEFYKQNRRETAEQEKYRLILTAIQLLKADIISAECCKFDTVYPKPTDMFQDNALSVLPKSLKILLSGLLSGKTKERKVAALGQSIMQGVRPRSLLMPLQVGLAVHLHNRYASKHLIDTLSQFGFCSSYSEVRKFEKNAAIASNTNDYAVAENQTLQHVADNVDHDSVTLDGKNTVHYMGMIAAITPDCMCPAYSVPRINVNIDELESLDPNIIKTFDDSGSKYLNNMTYRKYTLENTVDKYCYLDLLWKCNNICSSESPYWSGVMQTIFGDTNETVSSAITFKPMIPLPPTDLTCVYSTLRFVEEESKKSGKVPVCTFDQALWWKALLVLQSPRSDLGNFVIRLGGFHTLMSFLGCVGYIMTNTGLSDAMELLYAGNTVPHLLSGKAVNRSWRAHSLIDLAVEAIMLNEVCKSLDIDSSKIKLQFENLMTKKIQPDAIPDLDLLNQIEDEINVWKSTMQGNHTAVLWIQYMSVNDLMKKFIRAERLGDWKLHLQCLQEMMPYFAACSHNNYAKSVWLYLQQMSTLENDNPSVYRDFINGYHVIRRSERIWSGLSPDLVIEQTLMRSLKSTGGLTRGTGFKKVQRNVYLYSRAPCAEISAAIEEFTGKKYTTSNQHKEMRASRQSRDSKDYQKLTKFFQDYNPFTAEKKDLQNIVSGIVAHESVNVENTVAVGNQILSTMEGKQVSTYVFKRSSQVINLSDKLEVKGKKETTTVDPALLFQRLIAITSNNDSVNLEAIFTHELSPYPASLFESPKSMRSAKKPKLVESLTNHCTDIGTYINSNVIYVLDGGALLQKIKWDKQMSYENITSLYIKYVKQNYSSKCIIVFDSYPEVPSTKDPTHAKRSKNIGPEINVSPNAVLTVSKETFLSNLKNKQSIINCITEGFQQNQIEVRSAYGDADVLIATTAVECSKTRKTVLVGDDTDLLVLLWHYLPGTNFNVIMQTRSRNWDVKKLQKHDESINAMILFIHAFFGCDTASQFHGIAKDKVFKNERLKLPCSDASRVFYSSESTKSEIRETGEKFLLAVYNKKNITSLNKLRHKVFMEKVSGRNVVTPQNLPPTKDSAYHHFLRVYHQIQTWLGRLFDAEDWGWMKEGEKLTPIMMTQAAAPESLLTYVRCGCKEEGCGTNSCSCRKHGISCSMSCLKCNGVSCLNQQKPDNKKMNDDEEDEDVNFETS